MRASAFCWPRSVLAGVGGTRPAPALPPEGETGKGAFRFLAAAGEFHERHLHPSIIVLLQRFRAAWMRSPQSI
jgi:hypothetical protein